MTASVLPQTGVGRLALATGGLLAAAHLLGAQGARIGPVELPAWSPAWLVLPFAVAVILGRPGRAPSSLGRLAVVALALALVGWPLASWRARTVRPPSRLAASVDSVAQPGRGPRETVLLEVARLRRLPLWRLVGRTQDVSLDLSGFVWAPEDGVYVLRVEADDAVSVELDGQLTIGRTQRASATVPLTRGVHRLRLRYEQQTGPASLSVEWARPAFIELLPMAHFVGGSAAAAESAARGHSSVALSLLLSLAWWIAAGAVLVRASESRRGWTESVAAKLRASSLPGPAVLVAGALFLWSGAAALVYQVVWQRVLALHSGVGTYSVAIIVGAFMAGLGIGSLLGGSWSSRVTPARALFAFALVELAIGAFALISLRLYESLLDDSLATVYSSLLGAGVAHFVSLLFPTVLMGLSLPFLVRALVHDSRSASATIGYLYGINVVGAAIGALVTPWLLIRHFGLPGAVQAGAAANVLAGIGALGLRWVVRPSGSVRPASALPWRWKSSRE